MLARALATPSNLLVLDEPTNDLDLETLDLLQEMIADYPGTVLLVSHDRDFLDRTVTSVLAAEGNGRWVEYAGGYSDMLAQRGGARPSRRSRAQRSAPRPGLRRGGRPRAEAEAQLQATSTRWRRFPRGSNRLHAEAAALREALADPALFARDPAAFAAAAGDLETTSSALAAAEEEWLRLELLREERGGLGSRTVGDRRRRAQWKGVT